MHTETSHLCDNLMIRRSGRMYNERMNIMICMAVSRLLFFAKGARQINKIMIVSLSCFDLCMKREERAIDLLTANPYKLHPTDSKFF